jgi:hypothetical protein
MVQKWNVTIQVNRECTRISKMLAASTPPFFQRLASVRVRSRFLRLNSYDFSAQNPRLSPDEGRWNPLKYRNLKLVAGAGIEPATQGFSVLLLTVRNCAVKFAFVQ